MEWNSVIKYYGTRCISLVKTSYFSVTMNAQKGAIGNSFGNLFKDEGYHFENRKALKI